MVLTSGIVRTLPIPHEPGQSMDLRLLSWTQLEKARAARLRAAVQTAEALGEALLRRLPERNGADSAAEAEADADPLAPYDRLTLLKMGVVRWTYDTPVSEDALADLDETTAEWAARAVIGVVESEDARLKGSSPSTTP